MYKPCAGGGAGLTAEGFEEKVLVREVAEAGVVGCVWVMLLSLFALTQVDR